MQTASSLPGTAPSTLRLSAGREIALKARPLVMGVLNLTPDSFSDGGLWLDPRRALERAEELIAQGADLLDLGAESTRPGGGVYGAGARPVEPNEELDRLLPVLESVRARTAVPISVDTRHGTVARAALQAGADLINDISALSDPLLGQVVAEAGCPIVLMHSRGSLATMQRDIRFENLIEEVVAELAARIEVAAEAGIDRPRILVDPGIGFGKTGRQNLELLRRLGELHRLECPVVVGASRKRFIGEITGSPPAERQAGSLAAAAWAAHQGAAVVRVHDVDETVRFLRVWQAIREAEAPES